MDFFRLGDILRLGEILSGRFEGIKLRGEVS